MDSRLHPHPCPHSRPCTPSTGRSMYSLMPTTNGRSHHWISATTMEAGSLRRPRATSTAARGTSRIPPMEPSKSFKATMECAAYPRSRISGRASITPISSPKNCALRSNPCTISAARLARFTRWLAACSTFRRSMPMGWSRDRQQHRGGPVGGRPALGFGGLLAPEGRLHLYPARLQIPG